MNLCRLAWPAGAVFLMLLAIAGCQKPQDDAGPIVKEFEVISPEKFSGISNAVGFGNNWFVVTASDPTAHFPGYPDPNAPFYQLSLRGSCAAAPLEASAAAADPNHCSLAAKPGGNLAMVYQKPTGSMYGFDLMYREFSPAGALLRTEKVFDNKNWGAWPRLEFANNGTAHIASFAHAGYSLKYFRKKPGSSAWESFQITDAGTPLGDLQTAMNGGSFCVSARFGSGNTQSLRFFQVSGDTHTYQDIAPSISYNCDLTVDGMGNTRLLYTASDQLKLVNMNGWKYETVVAESNIKHRAKMALDKTGALTVAYQTPTRLVVMRKQNNQWTKTWTYSFPSALTDEQMGQGLSLIHFGSGFYVVFPEGKEIAKHKLQ